MEKEGIARDGEGGAKRGSGGAMKIFDEPLPAGSLGYRLDATRDNRVRRKLDGEKCRLEDAVTQDGRASSIDESW